MWDISELSAWESQLVIMESQNPTELNHSNDGVLHLFGKRVHFSFILQLLPKHLHAYAPGDVSGLW